MSDLSDSAAIGDAEFDPFAGPAISSVVPSTEAQREIWSAAQIDHAASLAYNEAVRIRLDGHLDIAALQAAMSDLAVRHEALRATFSADGLSMLIGEPVGIPVPVLDLTHGAPAERAALREAALRSTVTDVFDLEGGPLVRAKLLQVSAQTHELLLSAHHIVCDGWSFGVIAADLGALYSARRNRTAASLAVAPAFTDYAREITGDALGHNRTDDETFWLARFADGAPVLDLPTDRPRPALKTFEAAREDRVLPAELIRGLRAVGVGAGSSLFATLLAGFSTLLHRLSGQDDIVVGVPSAGQAESGRPGLVGHCVNMLPIRLRPTGSREFAAYLGDVRTDTLDAFDHQRLGFGRVVEKLRIARDPSRTPLVSVLFNVDRSLPSSSMPFDGIEAELVSIPRAFENFDLFLNAIETDAGMVLECQYNSDLFDRSTIQRWLESFELLLSGIAAAPATSLAALPIVTAADRAALESCNDTHLDVPPTALVHQLVEEQVTRSPGTIAIECQGERVTYHELNQRANRLAHHLQSLGVGRGSLIGLCLERSPDLLVALLAVLKSGAGYVPLDPNYPVDRLAYMATDAALAILITDARLAGELSLATVATVRIDSDAAVIAASPDANPVTGDRSARPEDPAYVIYTSGSTGKPKGVLVPHRSVVNLLCSVQREPGLHADDVVLAITTLSFDIAVSEVVLPLTVGARIVLASRETASDGGLLMELVQSSGVTFIDATPATYRLLLASGWRGHADLRLICTGEAMPRDLAETLTSCAREVWNGYGPTETTVWSTFARVQSPVTRVLIGRPVANTVVHIRDTFGEQVPIGVPGELYVGGRGVTLGYLNRPDLTAERFSVDPAMPGALLFRTGDLVRLLPTGELECLGRNDNQVKVRGFRIEPGEIETVLASWPGVRQATVIAREDRANDVRLVAYLVTDSDDVISDQLRAHAKASLPDYMVPYAFVRMTSMPLTPSGKVDRKALPAPQASASVASTATYVAPTSETEQIIVSLWAEVLGLARVGVLDDFFALGGHSLLASQVLSRLRRDHGIQLSFRKVFEAPTARALAAIADQSRAAGSPASASAASDTIPHRVGATSAPLSVLQERLWMLEELEPTQRSAHAHSASWRLFGALDPVRLDRAYATLIARHAMLRTSFHTVDGVRQQVVSPASAFTLEHRDLSALDADTQQVALVDFFREQQFATFEIDMAPLYRACLLKLDTDHHLLYSLQHGLVWDGWSFDIFLKELTELYAADEAGRSPVLAELPVTYGDFAAWQSAWLAGPEAKAQGDWWRIQLAGDLQELTLPTDMPRPALSLNRGNQISLPFTREEADKLRVLARKYDATLFMIVFAAYNVILHHYTGQADLLVGSPVRARTRPELEVIVGPFVNTVLLRTRVSRTLAFPELLRAVRDVTLDSFSNQELPFELLGTRVPPVRALFSMQDARERPSSMGSLRVEQYHVPQHFTTNDLMLWMMDTRTRLYAVLNYSTELFERTTAEAFLAHLRAFLLAVLENPEREIGSIPLAPAPPATAPSPGVAPLAAASIAEQIGNVADAAPDRVAVRSGRTTLTYGDLVTKARRVSAALLEAGVTSGSCVAVSLSANAERIVATLGVLGAGGTVVAVDPDDTESYRRTLLHGTKPILVVSDADVDDGSALRVVTLDELLEAPIGRFVNVDASAPALRIAIPGPNGVPELALLPSGMLSVQSSELATALSLTAQDVVAATLPVVAPASVLEMLFPLAAGATLLMTSNDAREDGDTLNGELARGAATVLVADATLWQQLLLTDWRGGGVSRAVVVAGALPAPGMLAELVSRVSTAWTLFSAAAVGCAMSLEQIRPSDAWSYATPLGLAGVRFDVRDADGRVCSQGIPGALCVQRDERVVRTGVRARAIVDGRLQLLLDDPGYRWCEGVPAAPSAIEVALRQHAAVAGAAVALQADASGTVRLVAYVVLQSGMRLSETELRQAARNQLPRQAVPDRFVAMSALPLDSDGAVRYHALANPFTTRSASSSAQLQQPRSETERLLVDVWKSALDVAEIGVQDNFFRLGGTSLLCFRVVEQVRIATGRHLNPRALLVGSLEQAAAELDAQDSTGIAPTADVRDQVPSGMLARIKGLIR